ncbi:unnamed protein product [Allacma fusca]|uniref:Uncharacterized protein n=1 Tax=Allacma fusca TaxID=39272 RepID=A0A8J2P7K8_9HEXA|nr:unnamed protein product [Allacma fusca]
MICSSKKSVEVEEPIIPVGYPGNKSSLENSGSGNSCPIRYGPMRILQLAEAGNVLEFEQLIREKPMQLLVRNNRGRTAAHHAALHNQVGILRVIEDCKGDIGVLDDEGNSPLLIAVKSEAVDCIHYLLQNRAFPGMLNKKSQAALHLAAECGKVKSLETLAQYFYLLDVNQPGDRGRTPLHLACINDHFECVKILESLPLIIF